MSEPGGQLAAAGAPADLAPEAGLGPVGDVDAPVAGRLAERDDLLFLGEAGGRAAEITGDDDLIGVVEQGRGGDEPVVGEGVGEPLVQGGGGHRGWAGGRAGNSDDGTML